MLFEKRETLVQLAVNREFQTDPGPDLQRNPIIQDLFIPTIDSIRNKYFLKVNIEIRKNLLMVGNTGTGKTVNIVNELNNNYFNDTFSNLITAFSGRTTCNQI